MYKRQGRDRDRGRDKDQDRLRNRDQDQDHDQDQDQDRDQDQEDQDQKEHAQEEQEQVEQHEQEEQHTTAVVEKSSNFLKKTFAPYCLAISIVLSVDPVSTMTIWFTRFLTLSKHLASDLSSFLTIMQREIPDFSFLLDIF